MPGAQNDAHDECSASCEDKVPESTNGGVHIAAVAVEEHREAVENAGEEAEEVTKRLLRVLCAGT